MLAGIKMVHVPYRGAMPALNDMVAGHVDMFFDTLATSVPLHRGDKVRILAVADTQRARHARNADLLGGRLPGFRSITWFGLAAPPGTPPALAQRINGDAIEMLQAARRSASGCRSISLEAGATSPAAPRNSLPKRPRFGAR